MEMVIFYSYVKLPEGIHFLQMNWLNIGIGIGSGLKHPPQRFWISPGAGDGRSLKTLHLSSGSEKFQTSNFKRNIIYIYMYTHTHIYIYIYIHTGHFRL